MIDMRATYGGTALGLGLFFGFCARNPAVLRAGLLASLMVLSGIAGGRLLWHLRGWHAERMDVGVFYTSPEKGYLKNHDLKKPFVSWVISTDEK